MNQDLTEQARYKIVSWYEGILKKLLTWTTEHAVTRKQFGKPLKDFELLQEKFARIGTTIYAMESMAYLTAGNIFSGVD